MLLSGHFTPTTGKETKTVLLKRSCKLRGRAHTSQLRDRMHKFQHKWLHTEASSKRLFPPSGWNDGSTKALWCLPPLHVTFFTAYYSRGLKS